MDQIAALVAAKAIVQLGAGIHAEGWGFFAVKRTKAPIAVALLLELDVLAHHILQAHARVQLREKFTELLCHAARPSPPFFFVHICAL